MKRIDMLGQRFGRLTVVAYIGSFAVGARWRCRCDCGNLTEVYRNNLVRNQVASCGCHKRETISALHKKHGMTGSPTFTTWSRMRDRCNNPNSEHYDRYGGRGIRVCERWASSFENFLSDMGERPKGMSIERIDNDGPYSPENCRWATQKEQMRNTSRSVIFQGKTMHQWSEELGIKYHTLTWRMRKYGSVFLPTSKENQP